MIMAIIGKMMITGQISWALESCKPGMGVEAAGAVITSSTTLNVIYTKRKVFSGSNKPDYQQTW